MRSSRKGSIPRTRSLSARARILSNSVRQNSSGGNERTARAARTPPNARPRPSASSSARSPEDTHRSLFLSLFSLSRRERLARSVGLTRNRPPAVVGVCVFSPISRVFSKGAREIWRRCSACQRRRRASVPCGGFGDRERSDDEKEKDAGACGSSTALTPARSTAAPCEHHARTHRSDSRATARNETLRPSPTSGSAISPAVETLPALQVKKVAISQTFSTRAHIIQTQASMTGKRDTEGRAERSNGEEFSLKARQEMYLPEDHRRFFSQDTPPWFSLRWCTLLVGGWWWGSWLWCRLW